MHIFVEFFSNMDISQVNQRLSDILAKKNPEEPTFYPVSGGLKFTKKSFDKLSNDTCTEVSFGLKAFA